MYSCFPAYAADCGIDTALLAGLRYLERVKTGTAGELRDLARYLRLIAIRAARHRQNLESQRRSDEPVSDLPDRERPEEQVGYLHSVRAALDALPGRQQQAVILVVYGGYSLREVAREMRIKQPTVRSYLKTAFGRLRQELSATNLRIALPVNPLGYVGQ